jgi:hypothetical protein
MTTAKTDLPGIGVQPIAPTAGARAERKNPPPQPSREKRAGAERAPGTGEAVDELV